MRYIIPTLKFAILSIIILSFTNIAFADDPLFEVKDVEGNTIFAVYSDGIRVLAPSGEPIMTAQDDSIRFYIRSGDTLRAVQRTLSTSDIGAIRTPGREIFSIDAQGMRVKDEQGELIMSAENDNIRFYVREGDSLRAVQRTLSTSDIGAIRTPGREIFHLDSQGMQVTGNADFTLDNGSDENPTFEISGIDYRGGRTTTSMFILSPDTTISDYIDDERMLWYPIKSAFRVGHVLIEAPDSVGFNSTATGYKSKAIGNYSQAMGYQNIARGQNSTAFGSSTLSQGSSSFAAGSNTQALESGTFAVGIDAVASGENSFSVGLTAVSSGDYSKAIGTRASATGNSSTAIGNDVAASESRAIVLGYQAEASGEAAISLGSYTRATNTRAVALGYYASADSNFAMAIGPLTQARNLGALAMGTGSASTGLTALALGHYAQSSAAEAMALGAFARASGQYSLAVGDSAQASNVNSIAVGRTAQSTATGAMAWGVGASASGVSAITIGTEGQVSGDNGIALGENANVDADNGMALGDDTVVRGISSTAIGSRAQASGDEAIALGRNARSDSLRSISIGASAVASAEGATAIGYRATASGKSSLALGTLVSTNEKKGAFVYGDNSSESTLEAEYENQFMVRASGGVYFYTDPLLSSGVYLDEGGSGWNIISDRHKKENFRPENGENVLQKVANLPIQSWNYKSQNPTVRHIGPTAQDFHTAFELGASDSTINSIDMDGINMLAIQALIQRTQDLIDKTEKLEAENAALKKQLDALMAR